jgi:hypothetical protein
VSISLSELRELIRGLEDAVDPTIPGRLTAVEAAVDAVEAAVALLPEGSVAVVIRTTVQSGIGSSATDLTGMTITTPPLKATNRYRLSCSGRISQQTAAGNALVQFQEGSTVLGVAYNGQIAAGGNAVYTAAVLLTGTGVHTYKLTALTTAGTMSHQLAATIPAHLLLEDLGAI